VVIEQALHQSGIPCRVRGRGGLLDQPEVKAALRALQDSTQPFAAAVRDLELEAEPDDAGSADDDRTERATHLDAVVPLAHASPATDANPPTAGSRAGAADTARTEQPDQAGDAVDVVTFHAAKGLEWPVVHLAGIEQGLVPIGHAQTPAELAEERRLFYVA